MPRLHLPYDEYTMPVRCPNHCFRVASVGRPYHHRTDLRASWPLRFCLTPHNDKGALAWYGKLTWESAHAWILIILFYLIV